MKHIIYDERFGITGPRETTLTQSYQQFIKQTPKIGQGTYIAPKASVTGAVALGDDVSVWPGAVIRGDMHTITIGHRSNVQDNSVLHVTHPSEYNPEGHPLVIGEDVTIGHAAILHGCTIGNRVLIGMGAIVMDGTIIESDVFLAAGSLVSPNKRLESGYLYRGRPAVKVRKISDGERKFLRYSPQNYIALKNEYIKL